MFLKWTNRNQVGASIFIVLIYYLLIMNVYGWFRLLKFLGHQSMHIVPDTCQLSGNTTSKSLTLVRSLLANL
jgi:hypothetical protein